MTRELDAISVNVYADLNQVVETAKAAEQELNGVVERARQKTIRFKIGLNTDSVIQTERKLDEIAGKERDFELKIKAAPDKASKAKFKEDMQAAVNKGAPIAVKTKVRLDRDNINTMRNHIKEALGSLRVTVDVYGKWIGWNEGNEPPGHLVIPVRGGPGGAGGGTVDEHPEKPLAAQPQTPLKQEKAPSKQASSTVVGGPAGTTRTTQETTEKVTVESKPAPGTTGKRRMEDLAPEEVIPPPTKVKQDKPSPSTMSPSAGPQVTHIDAQGRQVLEPGAAQGATVLAGRHAGGGGEVVSVGQQQVAQNIAEAKKSFKENSLKLLEAFQIGFNPAAAVLDFSTGEKRNVAHLDFSQMKYPKLTPDMLGILGGMGVDVGAPEADQLEQLRGVLEDTLDIFNQVKYTKPPTTGEVQEDFMGALFGLPTDKGPALRPGKGGMRPMNPRAWQKLFGGTDFTEEERAEIDARRRTVLGLGAVIDEKDLNAAGADMMYGYTRGDLRRRGQEQRRVKSLKEAIEAGEDIFRPEVRRMVELAENPNETFLSGVSLDPFTEEPVSNQTNRDVAIGLGKWLETEMAEEFPIQMKTLRRGGRSRRPELNFVFDQIQHVRSLLGRESTGQSLAGRRADQDLGEMEASQKRAESAFTSEKLEEFVGIRGFPPATLETPFLRDFRRAVMKRRQEREQIASAERELKANDRDALGKTVSDPNRTKMQRRLSDIEVNLLPGTEDAREQQKLKAEAQELKRKIADRPMRTRREHLQRIIDAGLTPLPTIGAEAERAIQRQLASAGTPEESEWSTGFTKFLRGHSDELEKRVSRARMPSRKMRKQKPLDPMEMEVRRGEIAEELLSGRASGKHAQELKAELEEITDALGLNKAQTKAQMLRRELGDLAEPRGENDPIPSLKEMAASKEKYDLKLAEVLEAEADEFAEEVQKLERLPKGERTPQREARIEEIVPLIGSKRERAAAIRALYKPAEAAAEEETEAMQYLKSLIGDDTEVSDEEIEKRRGRIKASDTAYPKITMPKTTKPKTSYQTQSKDDDRKAHEEFVAAQAQPSVEDVVMASDEEIDAMFQEQFGDALSEPRPEPQPEATTGRLYPTVEDYINAPNNQKAIASGRTSEEELRKIYTDVFGDVGEGPGTPLTNDRSQRNRLNAATSATRLSAVDEALAKITSPQMAAGMLRRTATPLNQAEAEAATRYLRGERAGTPVGGGGPGGAGGPMRVHVVNFAELTSKIGALKVSPVTASGTEEAVAAQPLAPLQRREPSAKARKMAAAFFQGSGIPEDIDPVLFDLLEGQEEPPFDMDKVRARSLRNREFIKQREDLLVSRAPTVALGQAFQTLFGGRPDVQIAIREAKRLETERETAVRRMERRQEKDLPKAIIQRTEAERAGDTKAAARAQAKIRDIELEDAFDKKRILEIEEALPGLKAQFEHINPVIRSFATLTGGAIAGTLLFGGTLAAAQAGIALLSETMKPGVELMTNFGTAAVAASKALGQELRQGAGLAEETVSQAFFRTGLEPDNRFRPELERAAVVGGGLDALAEQRQLLQAGINFRLNPRAGETFPVGGGPFGFGATNSALRELKNTLEGVFPSQSVVRPPTLLQDTERDQAIIDSLNAQFEELGVTLVDATEAGIDKAAAEQQRTEIGRIPSERDFAANESVAQVFANQLRDRGLVLVGTESGKPLTGGQFDDALGGQIIEATQKSVDALIEANARGIEFQNFSRRAQSDFARGIANPIQRAIGALAQPRLPLTAGVPGGAFGAFIRDPAMLATGLGSEMRLQQREARGRQAILDLVPTDQRSEVSALMGDLEALGKTAAGIRLDLLDRQTEVQLDQTDNSLRIMGRTIGELRGSLNQTFRNTPLIGIGASIGQMTARSMQLQRNSAMIGLESGQIQLGMNQRQLNLQTALAGLGVAGETPEERALRLTATREELADQQRLLDNAKEQQAIAEEATPLGFRLEDARIAQQIEDLDIQVGIALRERELIVDSRQAENTLLRLDQEIDATVGELQTYVQEGTQAWMDGLSMMGQFAQQTAADFGELAEKTADAFGVTVNLQELLEKIASDDYYDFLSRDETSRRRPASTDGTSTNSAGFATGGLFDTMGPTRMIVGEAGRETVAVLRNPRGFLASVGTTSGGIQLNVNVTGNTVRSDNDLNELVRRITNEVQYSLAQQAALRGLRSPA